MSIFKNDFLQNLSEFKIVGFENKYKEFVFERKQQGIEQSIVISTNKFFPNAYTFEGIIASIRFEKVELLLEEIVSKHIKDFVKGGHTLQFVYNFNNPQTTISNRRVTDLESFNFSRDELYLVINKYILPFLDQYCSLDKVSDLFAKLRPEEVVPYIQGPMLFLKVILCLKLSNHPDYIKKRDEYLEVLKIYSNKKEAYGKVLNAYTDMFYNQ